MIQKNSWRNRSSFGDRFFWFSLAVIISTYITFLVALLFASSFHTSSSSILRLFSQSEIRYALRLSLLSSTVSTLLSLWIAVPSGYYLARCSSPLLKLIEVIMDIPLILPPLVVGMLLLILFQTPPGRWLQSHIPVTYAIPSIIIAQGVIGTAYAVRMMKDAFASLDQREEKVAQTLGCTASQAFWYIAFPAAKRGIFSAAILTWARCFGEFGPILVFSGATRLKTEVLPTSIYLEMSIGNLENALAVSFLMIGVAVLLLLAFRLWGESASIHKPGTAI